MKKQRELPDPVRWSGLIAILPLYKDGEGDVTEVWRASETREEAKSVSSVIEDVIYDLKINEASERYIYSHETSKTNDVAIPISEHSTLFAVKVRAIRTQGDRTRGWIACEAFLKAEKIPDSKGCVIYLKDGRTISSQWSRRTVHSHLNRARAYQMLRQNMIEAEKKAANQVAETAVKPYKG